jgi:hypothetical protein
MTAGLRFTHPGDFNRDSAMKCSSDCARGDNQDEDLDNLVYVLQPAVNSRRTTDASLTDRGRFVSAYSVSSKTVPLK